MSFRDRLAVIVLSEVYFAGNLPFSKMITNDYEKNKRKKITAKIDGWNHRP